MNATEQRAFQSVRASDAIRCLGSFEQMFWLIDQTAPVHFAVTAQIAGRTEPRDWRKALDRLQERHPHLSARIEGRPGSLACFRHAPGAPIPLRIVEQEPVARWEAEVGEELASPFDPHGAPLVRAVLIQGVQESALILVAHHAIADGISLVYLIRDTLRALTGGTLERLAWLPAQDDILGWDMLCRDAVGQKDPLGLPATYRLRDGARPSVEGLRLPPDLTAKLRGRARKEETTVHGALCAALVLAGRQVSPHWRESPVRVFSPVDARPTLDVGEDCGVFLGAVTVTFEDKTTGFWDLARHAKRRVSPGKTRVGVEEITQALRLVVKDGPDLASASEFAATAFAREAMLTNLGPVPFSSHFGQLTLKALWGPAVLSGFVGEQTIGASTLDGAIHLTHTSYTPPDGLLAAMRSVLVEAT